MEKKKTKVSYWRKSIFRKIALIFLPFVLLADGLILGVEYKITYDSTEKNAVENLEHAAEFAAETGTAYSFIPESDDVTGYSASLDYLCLAFGLTYGYVLDVNEQEKSIQYRAIGFGNDAVPESKTERTPGVVVEDALDDAMVSVLHGEVKFGVYKENNRFGETLCMYILLDKVYDHDADQLVARMKPLVIGLEQSFTDLMRSFRRNFSGLVLLTVFLNIALVFIVSFITYRMISRPARRISRRMASFVEDQSKEFHPLPVKGNDEFAEMSSSFNTMAKNIDAYLENIKDLNKQKHTHDVEMDIAGTIQFGLLRKPHFQTEAGQIDAYMFPAKDVGGDLYDYLILEDGRVFLSVADVSGKGVTAALFMSRAITLLHLYAKFGFSPARILEEFNNTLAEQNPEMLFITTFAAIFDPKTGILTYSNGGHNPPYLLSDRLIPLKDAGGMAAGIFPDQEYEEATITMQEGDCLFLFTDGVNEARNQEGQFYTTEKLEEVLSGQLGMAGQDVISSIRESLSAFAGQAEQSDDITMLTFRSSVKPKAAEREHFHRTLHLPAEEKQLTLINSVLREVPGMTDRRMMEIRMMAEECFVNICSYAYPEGNGYVDLSIDAGEQLVLTFTDNGVPFDPTREVQDIDEYDPLNTIGGVGRFLTFELADQYSYEYRDGKNVLRLIKNLTNEE